MRVDNPTAVPVDIQEFGPGDHVWVMPDGAKLVHLLLLAGGSGGMQGFHGAPPPPVGDFDFHYENGPAAGPSGGWVSMEFPASQLPAEVPVSVGAGGSGGTGSTDDTGTDGSSGGETLFGDVLRAPGGLYGDPSGATVSMLPSGAAVPGGGLGGFIRFDDTIQNGSTAGRMWPLTPGATFLDPTADGADGADGASSTSSGPGASGSGGGASLTSDGGNGGNGGNYGTGGGGGGSCPDGFRTGDGGNGADGICIVTTYF